MRKHRLWLVLIAVLALIGGLVAVFGPSREPEYAGRRLSRWVRDLDPTDVLSSIPVYSSGHAEKAIRCIGTKALPYLLEWIRYEPPPWKMKSYEVAKWLGWHGDLEDKKTVRAYQALDAFWALGLEAHGAIPRLVQ